MNRRRKLFYDTNLKHGFYTALKCAGYSKQHGYYLLSLESGQEYMLSVLGKALGEIKLSLAQLLKERHALASDPDTPPKLRDDIYKDLINMVERAGQDVEEREKLTGSKAGRFLKPAKETPYSEINDKDKGNGKSEKNSADV